VSGAAWSTELELGPARRAEFRIYQSLLQQVTQLVALKLRMLSQFPGVDGNSWFRHGCSALVAELG